MKYLLETKFSYCMDEKAFCVILSFFCSGCRGVDVNFGPFIDEEAVHHCLKLIEFDATILVDIDFRK